VAEVGRRFVVDQRPCSR